MEKKTGCVYLVGAGCGAADLITLRGLHLLQTCQTVVYDDLIAPELLDAAPENAERIYMGKRCGKHAAAQDEISQTLVEKAQAGKVVVRLKGGDPFVFGRGGEEIQALQAAGIPYEEVPGISSSIAIPAAAGIPVTHRGASRSLHIITGHTAATENGLPEGFDHLAALSGTLVFLMGLNRLEVISEKLIAAGKDPETPAAVVSGGNSLHPAAVRGTLNTIAARARAAGVVSPAVIVVGDVAALDFSATIEHPLSHVRIGLTGTEAVTKKLKAALERQGAEVFLTERSVVDILPLKMEPENLCDGGRHWLVFTSSNGVRIFFSHLLKKRIDLRRLSRCKFAVIGKSTGDLLEQYGVIADLCPEVFTSAALAEALCRRVQPGEDVFFLRSQQGAEILPRRMREEGIPCLDVPLYTLHADSRTTENSRAVLDTLDYLTFSSASGVGLFLQTHEKIPENAVCVCIGEVTAHALRKRYKKPFLTADTISAQGIAQAILTHRMKENAQ